MLISPFTWSVIKRFVTVGQFYLLFISVLLHVCSLRMTDRTNRHNNTNRGEHGGYREFGGV